MKYFGPDHPTVAVRRSNLAGVLTALGEHQETRNQIQLALDSTVRQLGRDHPNVAIYRTNLAVILSGLGDHGEVLKQIYQALDVYRRIFSDEHPNAKIAAAHRENILRRASPKP